MITYFYELVLYYNLEILQRNSLITIEMVVVVFGINKATQPFKSVYYVYFLGKVVFIAYDGGEANLDFPNHNMGQTIFI